MFAGDYSYMSFFFFFLVCEEPRKLAFPNTYEHVRHAIQLEAAAPLGLIVTNGELKELKCTVNIVYSYENTYGTYRTVFGTGNDGSSIRFCVRLTTMLIHLYVCSILVCV